jgi:hypothetical protein
VSETSSDDRLLKALMYEFERAAKEGRPLDWEELREICERLRK